MIKTYHLARWRVCAPCVSRWRGLKSRTQNIVCRLDGTYTTTFGVFSTNEHNTESIVRLVKNNFRSG